MQAKHQPEAVVIIQVIIVVVHNNMIDMPVTMAMRRVHCVSMSIMLVATSPVVALHTFVA